MESWKHCLRSMRMYGESAEEVHYWLDQYWNMVDDDHSHRSILHNHKGVELGVLKFGEDARKHILLHLADDGIKLK